MTTLFLILSPSPLSFLFLVLFPPSHIHTHSSTYTGHYEDVKAVNDLLLAKKVLTGLEVPIHVDAASGGFVVPFVKPDLEWDFRLPLVKSINASGHKYGLCYPGIGWAIWRSSKYLPQDLVFTINYLGSDQVRKRIVNYGWTQFDEPGSKDI